jgi:rubrerythrin
MKLANELNGIYDFLNLTFFENTLSKTVITTQHDPKGKTYGWFTTWKAWEAEEEKANEINITNNYLDRNPEEIIGTLLHEMVHLYNFEKGIQDCSRGGTYHNKKFKEAAEAHGLIVGQSPKNGWAVTRLSEAAEKKIKSHVKTLTKIKRNEPVNINTKKSNVRKYVCPICGNSVRATKEVNIICGDCNAQMICEND